MAIPSSPASSSAIDVTNTPLPSASPSAAIATPTEDKAGSVFLHWGPCDWCMNMCSKPAPANQSCDTPAKSFSPAVDKEASDASEVLEMLTAATTGLESPTSKVVDTVNASSPLFGSYYETRTSPIPKEKDAGATWPPPLPEGIPERAPITVSMLAGELYLDGNDFTPAEGEMLKHHFENFTGNYGGEEQALNALKKKNVRVYVKILAIVHDFMDKYHALEADARPFMDRVVAFFRPVLASELNHGSTSVPTDADLAKQESALIKQYKALSLEGWMSLDAEFPALVDEIEGDIANARGGEAGSIGI